MTRFMAAKENWEIKIDNPYFQRTTQKRSGVQLDYMIQTRFNTVYICEIKFYRDQIGLEIINEMNQKIQHLACRTGIPCVPC